MRSIILPKLARLTLLWSGAMWLLACAPDALAGQWQTKQLTCEKRGEMVLDSDWTGTAEIPIDCDRTCEMECEAFEIEEDLFQIKVDIDTPSICQLESGGDKTSYNCTAEDEGSKLDCGNFHVWHWQGE